MTTVPQIWWIGGAAGAVVLVAVVLGVWRWRRARSLDRVMRGLAAHRLQDVFLPDGLGGLIHFDFLLLTRRGLLVLDVRHYPGAIFCGERIERWTQVLDSGSFGFPNPLDELNGRIQSLKTFAPQVPVHGRVVFTRESHFPKGHPEFVSHIDSLATDVKDLLGEVPERYLEAWREIEARAQPAAQVRREARGRGGGTSVTRS